jgi:hypothetical protein
MRKGSPEIQNADLKAAALVLAQPRGSPAVTVERIERAICTVADAMVTHDMDLSDTIRFLEAERDKLRQKTTAMDHAREILRRNGRNKGSNTRQAA